MDQRQHRIDNCLHLLLLLVQFTYIYICAGPTNTTMQSVAGDLWMTVSTHAAVKRLKSFEWKRS